MMQAEARKFVWGTYRSVRDWAATFSALAPNGLWAIDTAPNYQGGEADRQVARLPLPRDTPIFTKVGYTGGDPARLLSVVRGVRHSLRPDYIRLRLAESARTILSRDGAFECAFLHNPEHLWDQGDPGRAEAELFEALEAVARMVSAGLARSIGIASWSLAPNSERGMRILGQIAKSELRSCFRYYMYPVNILHLELLRPGGAPYRDLLPDMTLLASAPLAAGHARSLLGPVFSPYFGGLADPLAQSLALSEALGAVPVIGVTSPDHAATLAAVGTLPQLSPADFTSLVRLLERGS